MCHKFMAHPLFSFLRSFFHRISRMNRRHSCLSDYLRIFADIWPLANGWRPKYAAIVLSRRFRRWRRFFFVRVFCPTDFTDFHRFYGISGESLCLISWGICNDRTGRIRENPWVIATAGNLRINSVVIRWIKIPRHPMNKKSKEWN